MPTATPQPGRPVRGSTTGRPIIAVLDLLGRRWTLRLLWELRDEALGFCALQDACDGMSSSVLRDRLAELIDAGIIDTADDGRYRLTRHGAQLREALVPIGTWAASWARRASFPGRRT